MRYLWGAPSTSCYLGVVARNLDHMAPTRVAESMRRKLDIKTTEIAGNGAATGALAVSSASIR